MIKKEIKIDEKMVPFRASAMVPRLYRAIFHRDIFKDLVRLSKCIEKKEEEDEGIPIEDLEIFENVAYIMAKHADPSQPDTPDEWLDQFDMLSIYMVLPELLDLWSLNMETDAIAKKKLNQVAGK